MIEKKLVAGRVITLPNNFGAVGIPSPIPTGTMMQVGTQLLSIGQSSGFSLKPGNVRTATMQVGAGAAAHRDFEFLPWVPGVVSHAPLIRDMMTGPMSGCWLTTFRLGGVVHAGHVGTDTDPDKTDAANQAWINFAVTNPNDVIGGFNPLRHWKYSFPKSKAGENPKLMFFGIYGVGGGFWIMCGYKNATSDDFRIADIRKQIPVRDLDKLQHIDRPGV